MSMDSVPEQPERESGSAAEQRIAEQLLEQARLDGVKLVGPGGLLAGVTRRILESALEAEMTEHLGYEKGDPAGRGAGNGRNGHSAKTVHTDLGPIPLKIPRDRQGGFEPQIIPKHSRRVSGFNEMILSLYAKGLTTGEIQAHLAEVYGADVSRELVSKVTDAVVEDLNQWRNRPLDRVYAVVFIDAIIIKIRDGQVGNRPVYVVVGIGLDGHRDVLGMWVGTGGEGAKQWQVYLTELRNRGVADVLIVCSDGLKGLGEAIESAWPLATHQTCVVHLVRNSLRYSNRRDWQAVTTGLRTIYTAPTADAAAQRFDEFAETWQAKYPAMIQLWRTSWEKFTPFLAFDVQIRKLINTTNMIESLNSRFRQATRRRGHFTTEQAAMKILYLVVVEKRRAGQNIAARIPA
ncbi:IS256 family transposase [Hamadaea tsunoensis]|uniref:IS256 family transposase n=1 Tax=Hamadaea tsunoensis TaxID=53368 RepID=UPI0004031A1E|nr:IS256 family transposase [Hamadaea tsunoensis]